MIIFGDLPTWAVVLLCLLVAAILVLQNLGWLLWAKAMLDRQRRNSGSGPDTPTAAAEQRADGDRR
jgi:hypothetical protein